MATVSHLLLPALQMPPHFLCLEQLCPRQARQSPPAAFLWGSGLRLTPRSTGTFRAPPSWDHPISQAGTWTVHPSAQAPPRARGLWQQGWAQVLGTCHWRGWQSPCQDREGPPLTSQSPPSGALQDKAAHSGAVQGHSPSANGRAGRKPGRPPGKGVFSYQRENPTVKPSSPHPDPAGHRAHSLVNRQPQPPLETEGVLSGRTPPSRQRITGQGLGSPGQLAVRLGHSVPRAGASCDSFPSSPLPTPPPGTARQGKHHSLTRAGYSAGPAQASGQSGTTAGSTWDSRCT